MKSIDGSGGVVIVVLSALCPLLANADSPQTFGAAREIALYDGVAPGSENWNYTESTQFGASGPRVVNVVRPTLLHFPAAQRLGTSMIVAPGGGNRMLMMSYEGVDIAKRLNDAGVDAFVLKYRLRYTPAADGSGPADPQAGQDLRELSAADGRRSVRLLRERAAEFDIRPDRIGMIGFSAGGGPIQAALQGADSERPNFVAMIYAARQRGEQPIVAPEQAPPIFLAVAADDAAFVQSSIDTFRAWHAANVPAELHVFQTGAHGFVNKGGGADHFMDRLEEWIRVNGWLKQ